MKYLLYVLLICNSLNCLGQDQRLFENTWYLQKVIVSGVEHMPPSTEDFVTELDISTDFFNCIHDCPVDFTSWNVEDVNYTNSNFSLNTSPLLLGDGCFLNQEIIDFIDLHFEHYYENDIEPLNPFLYNIDDSGNTLSLTITNVNGDDAVYGNVHLSTTDFDTLKFSVSPNPVDDNLLIECDCNYINTIHIIDVSGKEVLIPVVIKMANTQSINLSSLKSGIYFLQISTDQGIATKKIIKN